jgi:cytochrome c-type biogenesis protein CcmH
VIVAALLSLVLAAAPASLPDIEDEVMCVICGTALNVSGAPAAERQREFIRRRIAEGDSKEEVKAALVAEYGEDVLAVPARDGLDLGVYLVPALGLLLGLGGVAVVVRRGKARPDAAPAAGPQLDPADAARLEADIAARDR